MSKFFGGIQKVAHKIDPVDRAVSGAVGLHMYHPDPVIPSAPTGDTAATSARQNQDFLRQRRGVLSNIFAGANQSAPAPTVAQKTLLGS